MRPLHQNRVSSELQVIIYACYVDNEFERKEGSIKISLRVTYDLMIVYDTVERNR